MFTKCVRAVVFGFSRRAQAQNDAQDLLRALEQSEQIVSGAVQETTKPGEIVLTLFFPRPEGAEDWDVLRAAVAQVRSTVFPDNSEFSFVCLNEPELVSPQVIAFVRCRNLLLDDRVQEMLDRAIGDELIHAGYVTEASDPEDIVVNAWLPLDRTLDGVQASAAIALAAAQLRDRLLESAPGSSLAVYVEMPEEGEIVEQTCIATSDDPVASLRLQDLCQELVEDAPDAVGVASETLQPSRFVLVSCLPSDRARDDLEQTVSAMLNCPGGMKRVSVFRRTLLQLNSR